ncbi:hypothetical protein RFI_06947, partial [Reticulomyxa filosa]
KTLTKEQTEMQLQMKQLAEQLEQSKKDTSDLKKELQQSKDQIDMIQLKSNLLATQLENSQQQKVKKGIRDVEEHEPSTRGSPLQTSDEKKDESMETSGSQDEPVVFWLHAEPNQEHKVQSASNGKENVSSKHRQLPVSNSQLDKRCSFPISSSARSHNTFCLCLCLCMNDSFCLLVLIRKHETLQDAESDGDTANLTSIVEARGDARLMLTNL